MKKIFIIIGLFLIHSLLLAQEKRAILFQFDGLDNLNANSFEGGCGAKMMIKKNTAVRLGFKFGRHSITTPKKLDSNQEGIDAKQKTFEFGITPAIEMFFSRKRMSPFIGAGLQVSWESEESTSGASWTKGTNNAIYQTVVEKNGIYRIGMFGLFGVEFFFSKGLSLAAEYRLKYERGSAGETVTKQEVVHGNGNAGDPTKIKGNTYSDLSIKSAGFVTLAVYFQ